MLAGRRRADGWVRSWAGADVRFAEAGDASSGQRTGFRRWQSASDHRRRLEASASRRVRVFRTRWPTGHTAAKDQPPLTSGPLLDDLCGAQRRRGGRPSPRPRPGRQGGAWVLRVVADRADRAGRPPAPGRPGVAASADKTWSSPQGSSRVIRGQLRWGPGRPPVGGIPSGRAAAVACCTNCRSSGLMRRGR